MKSKHLFRILIATCCILFLLPEDVMAQRRNRRIQFLNRLEHDHRPYHFGFALGVNTMNFSIKPVDDLRDLDPDEKLYYVLPEQDYGFHIGIVSSLKLGQFTDLRFIPTISFGERYLEYYKAEWDPRDPDPGDRQYLEATILEFPLHLKYKSARMTNTRVYVLSGVKYTHDLASIEMVIGGDPILARVGRNDVHYEVGAGFDQYFYYFKFSAEIKLSFGLTNLIRDGNVHHRYYDSIDRLNSRSLMVSLTFE